MKKLSLILAAVAIVALGATSASAQPFTPTMGSDFYGTTQGGGNLAAIITPRDNNDNLGGIPDPADLIDHVNRLFAAPTVGLASVGTRNSDLDSHGHQPLASGAGDWSWNAISSNPLGPVVIATGRTASNSNALSFYKTSAPAVKTPILTVTPGFGYTGDGTAGSPYQAAYVPGLASGDDIGFSLASTNGVVHTWDSKSSLNTLGYDHMLTYHLSELAGKSIYIDTGAGSELYTFQDPWLIAWEDLPYNVARGTLGDEDFDDIVYLVDGFIPNTPEPATMALLGSGLFGLAGFRRKKRS